VRYQGTAAGRAGRPVTAGGAGIVTTGGTRAAVAVGEETAVFSHLDHTTSYCALEIDGAAGGTADCRTVPMITANLSNN
jgi:hypothetical protein